MSDADRDVDGPDAAPDVDELVARHLSDLHAFVRLRAGRAIRAQESLSDLVQSVCREVLEARDVFEYRSDAEFRGWLFTAALRKIVERDRHMHRAKRDVRREVRGDPGGDYAGPRQLLDAYASIATPSRVLAAKEQVATLERAFDALSEEQREVLTLARIAGLTYAEIGERVDKSEEACRQIARRATIRLSMAMDHAEQQ